MSNLKPEVEAALAKCQDSILEDTDVRERNDALEALGSLRTALTTQQEWLSTWPVMRNGELMTQDDYEWLAETRDAVMESQENFAKRMMERMARIEAAAKFARAEVAADRMTAFQFEQYVCVALNREDG
jgi:hypothetical protein